MVCGRVKNVIGIIGGSGLDNPKILKHSEQVEVKTPYGSPSSPLSIGEIKGVKVAILARHGKSHSINPTNINYRANILALKQVGVKYIIASSACGSLKEEIAPGKLVLVDQFIDFTKKRHSTFFDAEKVAHIPMAEPFCPKLRAALAESARKLGLDFAGMGTVITIEGPRFSTKAESNFFRMLKADIVNMTTVPEVVLAREAGICYQVVAMCTDYDCFMDDKPPVTIDEVLRVMSQNADKVKKLILETIPTIPKAKTHCCCSEHIKNSIVGD